MKVKRNTRPRIERQPPDALIAYGPPLFGEHREDEADGARVGRYELVRGADGALYGVLLPPKDAA
jgi:hypothetical protein